MKLNSLNKYISLLIFFSSFHFLYAEDQIDIWNKEIKKKQSKDQVKTKIQMMKKMKIFFNH